MWHNKSKKVIINFCILALTLTSVSSNETYAKFFSFKKEKNEVKQEIKKDKKVEKKEKKFLFWKKKNKQKIETPVIDSENDTNNKVEPLMWDSNSNIDEFAQDEQSLQNNVFIKEIIIKGNNLVDVNDIKNTLTIKEGNYFKRENVQTSLKQIYEMGYFTNKMKAIPVKYDENNVILNIVVEENIPVVNFTIEGNKSISNGEIYGAISRLEGKPQNIKSVTDTINKIENLYSKKGYILARVKNVYDDPDGTVNFVIDEGIINSITYEGNHKTKDYVVKRNILTQEGSVYNENQLRADLSRLYATQAFKEVNRSIEQNENGKYDIKITLEEQRSATISLGGGIDSQTGFFGMTGLVDNNLFGRGQKFSINFMAGTGLLLSDSSTLDRANLQAEISFLEPKFLGSDTSMMVKAFGRDFASYQIPLAVERRYGGELTFSRRFKDAKHTYGSISLGVENVDIKEGDFDKIRRLYAGKGLDFANRERQLEGGLFATISPSITYDTRDDIMNPRRGTIANLRIDQAFGILDFEKTHARATATIKKYFPLMKKSSLSLMARGGGKIYGSEMPEVFGYRLGGPYTIRGFKMSEVGTGEAFMMASAEIQTPFLFFDRIEKLPFLKNIKLAFFMDAGQVFNSYVTDGIYNRPLKAITAGIGARIFIPGLGPLNVDWGIPLTNVGEGNKRGAFTFGIGDMYY